MAKAEAQSVLGKESLQGHYIDMRMLESNLATKNASLIEISRAALCIQGPDEADSFKASLVTFYDSERYFENRLAYLQSCGYKTLPLWQLVSEFETRIHSFQQILSLMQEPQTAH